MEMMPGPPCPDCGNRSRLHHVGRMPEPGERSTFECADCGEVFTAVMPEPDDDSTFADAVTPFARNH